MRRFGVVVMSVAALAAVIAGVVAPTASAAPVAGAAPAQAEPPPGGEFYEVPDPLPPGEPGEIIKSEEVPEAGLAEGTMHRVMYHSRSREGDDIAVTGLVAVPDGVAPEGGWPVISWAHGTTGIADQCAPSLDAGGSTVATYADELMARGYLMVGTDYEGLGTPGRHPYIVGESEARGTIDIVRAARELPGSGAGTQWAVWGHSQGGHAAMFTSALGNELAPELDLVATVAGAPPSQFNLLYVALQESPFRYYLVMAAAGINAAYPEADLSQVITDVGLERIGVVDEVCAGGIGDAYADLETEEVIAADPYTVEPWRTILDENDPRNLDPTDNPILIIQGGEDEQIPVVSTDILNGQLCAAGQQLQRWVYPGQSHAGVVPVSFADMADWIDARFAGVEPASSCTDPVAAARGFEVACPPGEVPEDGFADVADGNVHEAAVDCVAWREITEGTGAGFDPDGVVTRGQMASFIARLVDATGAPLPEAEDQFGDDDGSVHEGSIDRLAAAGVLEGFDDGTFRPGAPVERGQVATFVVRAHDLVSTSSLPVPGDHFGDDGASVHADAIDQAAWAGIVAGFADGTYRPTALLPRDQMASMLARLLDRLTPEASTPIPG